MGGDEEEVGFTAGRNVPGQAESRESRQLFEAWLNGLQERKEEGKDEDGLQRRFYEEFRFLYDELINEREEVIDEDGKPVVDRKGKPKTRLVRDWRKAAYEAWSSLPASLRQPKTITELADQLGLRNTATIRHWRQKDPQIEERFRRRLTQRLLEYAPDVLMALTTVASDPDSKGHQDRKLFLQLTGFLEEKTAVEGTLHLAIDDPLSDEEQSAVEEALRKAAAKGK